MFEKWRIEERMEVVDRNGRHIGTVDHIQGDQIKLAKSDSADGTHRYVPVAAVETLEENRVVLKDGATPMSEAEIAAASSYHTESAGAGSGSPLFGTSGTGTGMGGSGKGEH